MTLVFRSNLGGACGGRQAAAAAVAPHHFVYRPVQTYWPKRAYEASSANTYRPKRAYEAHKQTGSSYTYRPKRAYKAFIHTGLKEPR